MVVKHIQRLSVVALAAIECSVHRVAADVIAGPRQQIVGNRPKSFQRWLEPDRVRKQPDRPMSGCNQRNTSAAKRTYQQAHVQHRQLFHSVQQHKLAQWREARLRIWLLE